MKHLIHRRRAMMRLLAYCILALPAAESFAPTRSFCSPHACRRHRRVGRGICGSSSSSSSYSSSYSSATNSQLCSSLDASNNNDDNNNKISHSHNDRRTFLQKSAMGLLLSNVIRPDTASAKPGLVQFPCKQGLGNTYHIMHAGETLLAQEDIWSTNPLFLTNRESALSETGVEQVVQACQLMRDARMTPTVVKYSLAAAAIDASDVVSRELLIGRDRLHAEFVWMDPRAIGGWDMSRMSTTQPAVWAMDVDEAGKYGLEGRPPPNDDSTPHETLADQGIRLRQLLSLLETQYSGDTILLIFPDGTSGALLSALMAGIPLNRVHELELAPGEVRLDVTMASTLALLQEKQQRDDNHAAYVKTIERGRQELQRLRTLKENVSVKDQMLEKDRLEEEARAMQQGLARQQREEEERRARQERVRMVEEARRQRRIEAGGDDMDGMFGPMALGTLGVGAAAAVMALPREKDEEGVAMEAVPAAIGGNGTASVALSYNNGTAPALDFREFDLASQGNNTVLVPEFEKDTLSMSDPFDNDTTITPPALDNLASAVESAQRINGDRQATFVRPKPVDRKQAAEQAMREYMESDDGGQAWLELMVDLAQDEDEEELKP